MKVKVSQLRPNPFREIGEYPIDRAKVESLKLSIKETSFWENVLCRRNGDGFEIAYGHHRLQALIELGIKEVDIPVKNLTDAQMIRIMAEENLAWLTSPAVVNQTVLSVKKFLDSELVKCDNWSHVDKSISMIFASNSQFQNCKQNGIGRLTIHKFLGANWQLWLIASALKTEKLAKTGKLDPKAVEELKKVGYVEQFHKAVEAYDVPVKKQRKIAKQVQDNITKKKTSTQGRITRDGKVMVSIVEDVGQQMGRGIIPQKRIIKQKPLPNIAEFLNKCESDTDNLNRRLASLEPHLKELGKKPRLTSRLVSALGQLNKTSAKIISSFKEGSKGRKPVECQKR